MRLRRPIAYFLSAAVAASALTGCDSFSGHAAAAANSAQVQQLIEFIADLGLERDLRQALQSGGDLRQALLTLLGLENAANFNVDDLAGARPGQHAVQVWEVTAQSAEDAAALAASQIRAVLEQLKSNGVTEGRIGMVEVDGKYYVVVDVEVTEENTFEPVKPVSDDDDSEDTPSASAPTAMVDSKTIDLSSLGTEITATKILELAGKDSNDTDAITALDLSDCKNLTSIGTEAFQNCKKLTTVTLPKSLESIDNLAFAGCESLTSINLSGCAGLQSIGNNAFENCEKLTTVTLPSTVIEIGNYAFSSSGLTKINLSNCTGLQSISVGAFGKCQMTSINLSGCTSLESIRNNAFQNCASLETVLLPESLGEIGAEAFWNCTDLQSIYFQCVPAKIDPAAFKGVIPESRESKLTIHCPSSNTNELKEKLKAGGFTEEDFNKGIIEFEALTPLTYLLGL